VVGLVRSPGPGQIAPICGKEACAGLQVHDAAARGGVANNLEQSPFGNDFDGAGTTGPAEYDDVASAGKWRSIGERARASLFGVPVESPLADVPNVLAGRGGVSRHERQESASIAAKTHLIANFGGEVGRCL